MKDLSILAFANDTGSIRWRLQNPANYINSRTNHEMFVTSHKNWSENTLGADIVIAELWRNPEGVRLCKAQGSRVIYEADDIILGVGGKERSKLMQLTKEQEDQTKETIALCDAVTVTTEVLADHYRQFNKNVYVLPNYMDFLWWGEPWQTKKYGETLRIGWMGSYSHHEDLLWISEVMERVVKEFPFVKFIYCGHGGNVLGLNYGQDIFEKIPSNRREFYPGVSVDYWPYKAKSLNLDIGIPPLLDDEFNAGKSPIKWMEYAACGVPSVLSDTVVYNKVVKHGVNALLAKSKDEWYNALEKLILSDDLRHMIAKEAMKEVFTKWNLDDHYEEWIEVFNTL